MQDPSYFFSIHELLLFARLARVNLVVTTYQQDEFCVAGSTGSVGDTSAVVYVCLSGDSHARVRGHVARMWTWKEVDENRRAWDVECEMRAAREDARAAAADLPARQLTEEKNREAREIDDMEAEDRTGEVEKLKASATAADANAADITKR